MMWATMRVWLVLVGLFPLIAVAQSGDFSGDGMVDVDDFNLLLASWGDAVPPAPAGWVMPPTGPRVDNDEYNAMVRDWEGGLGEIPAGRILGVSISYTPADAAGVGYVANDFKLDFQGQLGGQQLYIQLDSGSLFNSSPDYYTPQDPLFIQFFPERAFDSIVAAGELTLPREAPAPTVGGGAVNIPGAPSGFSFRDSLVSLYWSGTLGTQVVNGVDFPVARMTFSPDASGTGYYFGSTADNSTWLRKFRVLNGFILFSTTNLPGDYNADGRVDLADYTVWRDHYGAPAGTLANDDWDAPIGMLQYETWRSSYAAQQQLGGSLSTAMVPEPSSYIMLLAAVGWPFVRRLGTRAVGETRSA